MRKILEHREKFLRQRPDLTPLVGDRNEALLRWASTEMRVITFTKFEGEEFYTPFDLESAQMWAEKEGKVFS